RRLRCGSSGQSPYEAGNSLEGDSLADSYSACLEGWQCPPYEARTRSISPHESIGLSLYTLTRRAMVSRSAILARGPAFSTRSQMRSIARNWGSAAVRHEGWPM